MNSQEAYMRRSFLTAAVRTSLESQLVRSACCPLEMTELSTAS